MYKYDINKLKQMAEELANNVNPPYTILLQGNLGVGKTTFSQFFLQHILINKQQVITSPTFNIINVYETIKGTIWHVDLYRLENKEEIFNLGLLEFIYNGIALIEWPEIIYDYVINSNIPYKVIQL
jgi:tRNA threonylcarbamoyladenosine biosynthesis protein TsaE